MDEILAWHFLSRDGRFSTRLPGQSRPLATPGWSLRVDDPERMRQRHLCAWPRVVGAILCAGRPVIACRVRLSGTLRRGIRRSGYGYYLPVECEFLYGNVFTVLWLGDATHLLHRFTCDLAEQVLLRERAAGREPDATIWGALAKKRMGMAGAMRPDQVAAVWHEMKRAAYGWRQASPPIGLYSMPQPLASIVDGALWPYWSGSKHAMNSVRGVIASALSAESRGLSDAMGLTESMNDRLERQLAEAFASGD